MPDFSSFRPAPKTRRTPNLYAPQQQPQGYSDREVDMWNAQRGMAVMQENIARAGGGTPTTRRTGSSSTSQPGVISAGEKVTRVQRGDGSIIPVAAVTGDSHLIRPKGSANIYVSPSTGERFKPDPASPMGLSSIGTARAEALAKQAEKDAKLAAKQAVADDKEAIRQENDRREAAFAAEGRPSYTDAHGRIQPKQSDEAWEATKKQKQAGKQKANEYLKDGRRFYTDKITGQPVPMTSDEEHARNKAEKMAKIQKEAAERPHKQRLDVLKAELSNPDLKVSDKDLKDADEALTAASAPLMALRGNDDFVTPISDDEVKAMLKDADPAKKAAANAYLNARENVGKLAKAEAQRKALEQEVYKTNLRIAEPEKYAEELKAEAPAKSAEDLKAHAAEIEERIKARAAEHKAETDRIKAKDDELSAQHALTKKRYDEALAKGEAPAVIGTLGDSLNDLEEQMTQWESESQDQRAAVNAQAQEINNDVANLKILASESEKRQKKAKNLAVNPGAHGYPVVDSKEAGVDDYLKQHPEVAGMAWGGGENGSDHESERVIIANPYNKHMSDPVKRDGLYTIEAARHKMSESGYDPQFKVTEKQKEWQKTLGAYASDDKAFRQSIISRLLVNDDVPDATEQQLKEAEKFKAEHLPQDEKTLAQQKHREALDAALPGAGKRYGDTVADAQKRAQDLRDKYPDPSAPEAKAAFEALQKDFKEKVGAITKEAEAEATKQAEAGKALYDEFGKDYQADWSDPEASDNVTSMMLVAAEKHGLTEKQARYWLSTYAQSDWDRPSAVGKGSSPLKHTAGEDAEQEYRVLPNGNITVNPGSLLDKEEYERVVKSAPVSREAKEQALKVRQQIAPELAEKSIATLRSNDKMAEWLDKNTSGTDLERMEQFTAKMKAGGWTTAAMYRFASSLANMGASWTGAAAAATGSDTFTQTSVPSLLSSSWWKKRAEQFDTAAGTAEKGTNLLGKYAAMAVGGIPSVAESMVAGNVAGGVLKGAAALKGAYRLAKAGVQLKKGLDYTSIAAKAGGLSDTALQTAGVSGAALDAAIQQGGSTYVDAYDKYLKDEAGKLAFDADGGNIPKAEIEAAKGRARMMALKPAILDAAQTAALTALGGAKGTEAIFRKGGKEALKEGVKKSFGKKLGELGLDIGEEALEEYSNQFVSGVIAQATYEPEKTIKQIFEQAFDAGIVGGVLGGLGGGMKQFGEYREGKNKASDQPPAPDLGPAPTPSILPEQAAANAAAIDNWTPTGALPSSIQDAAKAAHGKAPTPEQHADTARTAAHALVEIAAGQDPRTMSPEVRRALGIKTNSKTGAIEPLSKNVTPLVDSVADEKGNHQPVITDAARSWLAQEVPGAGEAVKLSYSERVDQIKNPPKPAKKPVAKKAPKEKTPEARQPGVEGVIGDEQSPPAMQESTGGQSGEQSRDVASSSLAPAPKLPRELASAKPAYSYGEKQFKLEFESDIDRAAYIAAKEKPSKRDADFVAFVMKHTGMNEAAVRAHGAAVRAYIKPYAAEGKHEGTILIPSQRNTGSKKPAQASAAKPAEAKAANEQEDTTIAAETDASLQARTAGPDRTAYTQAISDRRAAAERLVLTIKKGDKIVLSDGEEMVAEKDAIQKTGEVQFVGNSTPVAAAPFLMRDRATLPSGEVVELPAGKIVRAKDSGSQEKPQPAEQEKAPRGTSKPDTRKVEAQGLAGGELIAKAEKDAQKVVDSIAPTKGGGERVRAAAAKDAIIAALRRYNGHLPIDLAKGDIGFSYQGGKVLVDVARAVKEIAQDATSPEMAREMAQKLFDHEIIHFFAVNTVGNERIMGVWDALPADVRKAVQDAYSVRLVATGAPALELNEFSGGHEYFRAMVEATRTGVLSEQVLGTELAAKWKQYLSDVLAFLRDLSRQFASIKSDAKRKELMGKVDAIRKEITDALDAFEKSLPVERAAAPQSFVADLEMSGFAKFQGSDYKIKASGDNTFYVERTTNGTRETISSGHPDIESARNAAIRFVEDGPSSDEKGMGANQPDEAAREKRGEGNTPADTGSTEQVQRTGLSLEEAKRHLTRPGQILGFDEKTFLDSQRNKIAPRVASNSPGKEPAQAASTGAVSTTGTSSESPVEGSPNTVAAADVAGSITNEKPSSSKNENVPSEGVLSVYPRVINGQDKWLVQQGEKRGFGDSIHDTEQEAVEESTREATRRAQRAQTLRDLDAQVEAEAKAKREKEDLGTFTEGMSPMKKGGVVKQLTAEVNYRGTLMTRRDLIQKMVKEGRKVETEEGQRVLSNEKGEYLGEKVLTKAGIDYALHLIAEQAETKSPAITPPEIKEAAPSLKSEGKFSADDKAEFASLAEGLFQPPSAEVTYKAPIPPAKLGGFITLATKLAEREGEQRVDSPEKVAAFIDEALPGGKARALSDAFWSAIRMTNPSLPAGEVDWQAIYAPKVEEAPTPTSTVKEKTDTVDLRNLDKVDDETLIAAADTIIKERQGAETSKPEFGGYKPTAAAKRFAKDPSRTHAYQVVHETLKAQAELKQPVGISINRTQKELQATVAAKQENENTIISNALRSHFGTNIEVTKILPGLFKAGNLLYGLYNVSKLTDQQVLNGIPVGKDQMLVKEEDDAAEPANAIQEPSPQTKAITSEMIAAKVEELLRAPTKATRKPVVSLGSQTEENAFKRGFEAATQKQGELPPPGKTGLSPKDRKWDDAWRKGWASGQTFVRSLPDTPAAADSNAVAEEVAEAKESPPPEAKALPERGDTVTWTDGAGKTAVAMVDKITTRDGKTYAWMEWFGTKEVPLDQLTIKSKSGSRTSREKREAEAADIPVKEVTAPAKTKEKKPADTSALRGMKTYLLDKLDEAIAAAPDEAKLADVRKDLVELMGLSDKSTTPSVNQAMEKLREKYNLDAKAKKADIDAAVRASVPSENKVVIEIPGDGTFTLWNDKKTLKEFAKKAKSFPTTTPRADTPTLSAIRPSGIPALKTGKTSKADLVKVAGAFASTDETRQAIMQVADFGDTLVATSGKVLFKAPFTGEGTETDPMLYTASGGKIGPQSEHEKTYGKYPGWQQVVPKDLPTIHSGLDTGRLWQVLKQASAVFKDTNFTVKNGKGQTEDQTPYVLISINPDGSLAVRGEAENKTQNGKSTSSNIDTYEHNVQPGSEPIGRFDADLLMPVLAGFRALGQEKVSIQSGEDRGAGAIVLSSPAAEVVIMRVGGKSPSERAASQPKPERASEVKAAAEPTEYEKALLESREASAEFRIAQEAYRAGQIDDEAFLKARKLHDEASAKFDAAYSKSQKAKPEDAPSSKQVWESEYFGYLLRFKQAGGESNSSILNDVARKAELAEIPPDKVYRDFLDAGVTSNKATYAIQSNWKDWTAPGEVVPAKKPRLVIGQNEMNGLSNIADGDVFEDKTGKRWILSGSNNGWQLYREGETNQPDYSERHPTLRDLDGQREFVREINRLANEEPAFTPGQRVSGKKNGDFNRVGTIHSSGPTTDGERTWFVQTDTVGSVVYKESELKPEEVKEKPADVQQEFKDSIKKDFTEFSATFRTSTGSVHDVRVTKRTTNAQIVNRLAGMFSKLGKSAEVVDQARSFVDEWNRWHSITGNVSGREVMVKNAQDLAKNLPSAAASTERKPRAPKKPKLADLLAAYFTPGKVVKSYGGFDRVISLDTSKTDQWNVTVQAVKQTGGPIGRLNTTTATQEQINAASWEDENGSQPRTHHTLPSQKDLDAAWKAKQETLGEPPANEEIPVPTRAAIGQTIRRFEQAWKPFFTYSDDTAPKEKRKAALRKIIDQFATPENSALWKQFAELPTDGLVPEDAERVAETKELLPYLEGQALGAPPSGYKTPDSMLAATKATMQGMNKPTAPAFQSKDLHAAYQRAIRGTSTAFTSIRSVFDAAKKDHPSLSADEFKAQVKADYYVGLVGLEPADSASTTEKAGQFTMRDSLGVVNTNMVFMPTTEAEMIDAAERDTTTTPDQILSDWAGTGEALGQNPTAQDAEYMAAVESGDVAKQQAMVDAAAKRAGYTRRVFHGTTEGGFQHFDPEQTSKKTGFVYFSTGKGTAASYSGTRRELPSGSDGAGIWNLYLKEPEQVWDFEEAGWDGQKPDGSTNEWYEMGGIDGIAADAKRFGIQSFEVQNVLDEGPNGDTAWYDSTIAVSDPSLIKSADPITRDAEGNVIPLSKRFNHESNSILFQNPAPIDPTVANQGDTDENREAFARARGSYVTNELTKANFEEIRQKVEEQIDEDEQGMLDNIQYKVANDEELSLEEEIARRMLANRLRTRGVRENDQAMVTLADSLWGQDIRDATETARKLAVRVDQFQSPQERLDAAMGRIIAPNRANLRERLTNVWTPSAKRREIARLEGEIAKAATAASRASLERTLAEAKARMDQNDLIDKMAAENREAVDKVLTRLGLTQADLSMTPDDRHSLQVGIMDSSTVKAHMVNLSPEVQKAIEMSVRGYADAAIVRDTGLSNEVVGRVTEHFRNEVAKKAVSQMVKVGRHTMGSIIEGGKNFLKWILGAPPAPLQGMVNAGVKNAANVQAQVQAILNAAIPTRRNRNRRALHAAVVNGKKGQKITVFVPYDPTDWQQVYRVARELSTRDATAMSKVYEYWINGILSGPQTHVVNTASNVLSTLWHYLPQFFASATVNSVIRDPNSTQWGEWPRVWAGFMKGIKPAMENFALAWRTEADPIEYQYLDRPVTVMFNDAAMEKAGGGRSPAIGGPVGRVIRIPGRFLVAMDAFAKTLIMHGEVSAQAYRLGKKRGLSGVALENFMASQIAVHGSESWEGALQTAKELTFQDENDITKTVEKLANAAKQAKYVGLLAKFLFPFIRTPTNIYRAGMRKAGGSAGILLWKLGQAGFYKMKEGRPFFDTYAKGKMVQDVSESVMAGILWFGLMAIAEGDPEDEDRWITMTGTRPYGIANAGERTAQLEGEGGSNLIIIRKNPVTGAKLDKPIRIAYGRYEPLALTMGSIIDAAREFKEWTRLPAGDQTAGKLAGTIASHLASQAQDKTFLQGVSGIMDFFDKLTSGRYEPGQEAAKFLINGAIPNLIRQPLKMSGPEILDSHKAHEILGSANIGNALADGEAKITTAGKPVTRAGNQYLNVLFPGTTEPGKATFYAALKDWNTRHPGEKWNPDPITKGDWYIYDPAKGGTKGKFPLKDVRQISLFEKMVGNLFASKSAQALGKLGYRPGMKATPDMLDAVKKSHTDAIKQVRSMPPSAFIVKAK